MLQLAIRRTNGNSRFAHAFAEHHFDIVISVIYFVQLMPVVLNSINALVGPLVRELRSVCKLCPAFSAVYACWRAA